MRNGNSLKVQLCGQLTEEYLPEIQRVLDEGRAEPAAVTLDLECVCFVDRAAMRFLLASGRRSIRVENCPSYVSRWIEQEGV